MLYVFHRINNNQQNNYNFIVCFFNINFSQNTIVDRLLTLTLLINVFFSTTFFINIIFCRHNFLSIYEFWSKSILFLIRYRQQRSSFVDFRLFFIFDNKFQSVFFLIFFNWKYFFLHFFIRTSRDEYFNQLLSIIIKNKMIKRLIKYLTIERKIEYIQYKSSLKSNNAHNYINYSTLKTISIKISTFLFVFIFQ